MISTEEVVDFEGFADLTGLGYRSYTERVLSVLDVPIEVWDYAATLSKMIDENMLCLNLERAIYICEYPVRRGEELPEQAAKLLIILRQARFLGYEFVFLFHGEF
jgi:hypothetical protein